MMMAASAVAFAQDVPQWRISEVSGNVRIVENGRSRPATRGALLSSGSAIATAAQARAVLVRGREYVVVSPRTQLRVPEDQVRSGIIQMLTDWGTALFRIERQSTPHFGVQTPYLAAVVKGTVFTVTVGPVGASVQVTEGAVQVSTVDAGAADLVEPGTIASVAASDLYQLAIEGEVSRVIRSDGTPIEGVVTIPVPARGVYDGPAAGTSSVAAPVGEAPISITQTTSGLIAGDASVDLAMVDIREATSTAPAAPAPPPPAPPPPPKPPQPPPPHHHHHHRRPRSMRRALPPSRSQTRLSPLRCPQMVGPVGRGFREEQ